MTTTKILDTKQRQATKVKLMHLFNQGGFNNELQTSTRDTLSNCGISEESETQVKEQRGEQ